LENHTEDKQELEPEPNHTQFFEKMNRQTRIHNIIFTRMFSTSAQNKMLSLGKGYRGHRSQITVEAIRYNRLPHP
jgi:hypothetical protein